MSQSIKESNMLNVMAPQVSLLCKIGSILVHFDEWCGDDGRNIDLQTARGLMADREVQEWLTGMDKLAMLPVKRK